jgi:hypothetical protein
MLMNPVNSQDSVTMKYISLHAYCLSYGYNLGLGAVCAVSAMKVKAAGPAKDDFTDAAVNHRTDVSSGPQSDRPRFGFLVYEADQACRA